jgi:hypothetical protein
MSLKFAAIGNLMALSALENRAMVEDRFKTFAPVEMYDPLLAMIGRGRRSAAPKQKASEVEELLADRARW